MRLLTLSIAVFSALVCAGAMVVLFILPATSVLTHGTNGSLEIRGWSMLTLLLVGLASGIAIVVRLRKPVASGSSWLALILTVAAAAIAIVDFILARYGGSLGSRDVPWLNISIFASAVLFWVNRQEERPKTP